MKYVLVLLITFMSSIALAKGKWDRHRQPVPGGPNADAKFYKNWEVLVKNQRIPFLPKASEIPTPSTDKVKAIDAKRYIFHLDPRSVDFKNEAFEDGYFYFVYKNKEQGNLLLAVHPKYRECFDNLKAKFDQMQWQVFPFGKIEGLPIITLERPRQCLGTLKYTGSKLPTAKSEFDR